MNLCLINSPIPPIINNTIKNPISNNIWFLLLAIYLNKSIRFPVEINSQIIEIVDKANEGLDKKEYSFNGFVVSACEFALKHMK